MIDNLSIPLSDNEIQPTFAKYGINYLQNLNDKDNAVQMQYCQYQYLINKDNAVVMQYTHDRQMQYTLN
jgi:hypothetical protein